MASSGKDTGVFIGAASGMDAMTDAAIYGPLLATGDIGIYGHLNGVYDMVVEGRMQTLTSDWSGSASGVAELGMDSDLATARVTVRNNGTTALSIPVGTPFSTAGGTAFNLLAAPGQPGVTLAGQVSTADGYVSGGASSMGHYLIQPGASVTLDVQAAGFGSAWNQATNAITSSGIAGLAVVSSTAATGGEGWTDPALDGRGTASNTGFLSSGGGDIEGLFHAQGFVPTEANVNLSSDDAWTANDLLAWKGYVDNARAEGILNVAPVWSANGLDVDYSGDFATSAYFANVREAALYGGGLSFDSPPWFFNDFTKAWFPNFNEAADTYVRFIEQQIKWATSEGLRTSMIISPNDTDSGQSSSQVWDHNLLAATKTMVARLQADGAMPSQFIVENYSGTTGSNTFSATQADSLNSVALFLSTVSTVSTTSESGLEVAGRAPPDMIVDGIVTASTIAAYAKATPYGNAVVGVTPNGGTITLVVRLTGSGTLSDAAGSTISADGLSYSASGTAAAIQADLRGLVVADASPTASTATLSVSLTDASGTIGGSTSVSLAASPSPAGPLAAALSGSVSVAWGASALPFLGVSPGAAAAAPGTVSVRVSLSGMAVLWDAQGGTVAPGGTSWTFSGTVAAADAALACLYVRGTDPNGGLATLYDTVAYGTGSSSSSGKLVLGAEAAYVTGPGYFSVCSDARVTATISTLPGSGSHVVFGGAAALDYTGGNTTLVLNGSASTGAVRIASVGGGNVVWAGTGGIAYTAGGHSTFIMGDGTGVQSHVSVTGGANGDTDEFDIWGNPGETQTVVSTSPAASVVFGGASNVDFSGGNSTVVLNGPNVGAGIVRSMGGDTVWAGASRLDFYEGAGNDTVVGGAGVTVVHGAVSGTGTTTFLGFLADGEIGYYGGSKDAVISVHDGNGDVYAGSGKETATLDGSGGLNMSSSTSATGAQFASVSASATGNFIYHGGGSTADLVLGGGSASITTGLGNVTLVGGSGNLQLYLEAGGHAALAFDAATGGNADVFGFDPSKTVAAFKGTTTVTVGGGLTTVLLGDGHRVVFHGLTSDAGMTFG